MSRISELINYRVTFCPKAFNNRILMLKIDISFLQESIFIQVALIRENYINFYIIITAFHLSPRYKRIIHI